MHLHEQLGVRLPLFSGAMAGAAGGRMCGEMQLAGGFGFLQAGYLSIDKVKAELKILRDLLKQPHGRLQGVGMGYLCWILEQQRSEEEATELMKLGVENMSAIWLAFGANVRKWVQLVRDTGSHDIKIFVVVSNLEEAIRAASWGADILVVQGIDAGGHGAGYGVPLFTLLPQISDHFRTNASTSRPRLIAAGGIVHPSQVAAALALQDCEGAVLGTALLATSASLYSEAQKKLIIAANATGPRTMLWDNLRGTSGWPAGIDGRGLDNASSRDAAKGMSLDENRKLYAESQKRGEADRIVTWAGTSVAFVSSEPSLAAVVTNIENGAQLAIDRASSVLKSRL